jgi:hypothetical protein
MRVLKVFSRQAQVFEQGGRSLDFLVLFYQEKSTDKKTLNSYFVPDLSGFRVRQWGKPPLLVLPVRPLFRRNYRSVEITNTPPTSFLWRGVGGEVWNATTKGCKPTAC